MNAAPLYKLSIVIPARDEAGCIASTVEHLHLELRLNQIEHEIIVVDDGSSDQTFAILQELTQRIQELRPVQNTGQHGFGRAICYGLEQMSGDAVVIMMTSLASRDVVETAAKSGAVEYIRKDLPRSEVTELFRQAFEELFDE